MANLNISEMLDTYEIDKSTVNLLSDDPAPLVKLRAIYEAQVAEMKFKPAITKEESNALKDRAKENANAQALASVAMSNIRESVYLAMDEDSDALVLIHEEMKELMQLLNFEMKEWVVNNSRTPEQRIAAAQSKQTRYDETAQLRELIMSLWGLLSNNFNLTDDTFKTEGAFPVKDSTSGIIPVFSKMPHDPSKKNEEGKTTKKVSNSSLRFKWTPNEENAVTTELPAGTMGTEVARDYVNSRKLGVKETWKSMRAQIASEGKNISTDEWKLEFATGTLEGYIAPSEEVSS